MLVIVLLIKKKDICKTCFNFDLLFFFYYYKNAFLGLQVKTRTEHLIFCIPSYVFKFVMAKAVTAIALARVNLNI